MSGSEHGEAAAGSKVRIQRLALVALAAIAVIAASSGIAPTPARNTASTPAAQAALSAYGRLPLSFIENHGQIDGDVPYYATDASAGLYFTHGGLIIRPMAGGATDELRVEFASADPAPALDSLGRAPGVVNYYDGTDADRWFEGVPTHTGVRYREPWPGIDVRYEGATGKMESTYVVSPRSDPRAIELHYSGQTSISIGPAGDLALAMGTMTISESAPVLYQDVDGERNVVAGGFELRGDDTVGFRVGAYDRTSPLLIDPTLTYSTYLGGSGSDQANAVAVDSAGSAYVAGFSDSPTGPLGTNHGGRDAFVTKLNAAGSSIVYSTFIGGAQVDEASSIAVDASTNAYVAGDTTSTDFPTASPSQATNAGLADAVVFKLGPSGALAYSTYLGGTDDDRARSIAIDGSGNAYVAGKTISAGFPAFPAGTAFDAVLDGVGDGFVAKVDTAAVGGTPPAYSTYLGGGGDEDATSIAIDASGEAFVAGWTNSSATLAPAFPTAGVPLQASFGGGTRDAYVTKLNAAGTGLTYSTYLGGGGADQATSIVLEPGATPGAYVAGLANGGFPTTGGAHRTTNAGNDDAFVAKLDGAGSSLVYSTFVGGAGGDAAAAMAVDSGGNAQITGSTFSSDFPTSGAFQAARGGGADAFVTKVDATGSALVYSSYLGGTAADRGWGIANAPGGHVIVAGSTLSSSSFPTASPYQPAFGGLADAFVANVDGATSPPQSVGGIAVAPNLAPGAAGRNWSVNLIGLGVLAALSAGAAGVHATCRTRPSG